MAQDDYNKGLYGTGRPSNQQGWADWQRGQHDKAARDALEQKRRDNLYNPGRNAPNFAPVRPSAGGGSGLGGVAIFLLLAGCGSAVMALLYPLGAAAVALTYLTGRGLWGDASGAVSTLVPAIPALVVLIVSSRIEQRLGRHGWYRALRHLLRLLLLAVAVVGIYLAGTGATQPASIVEFSAWIRLHPGLLATVAVTLLAAHFLLWKATRLREAWHRLLERSYLRSA